MYLENGILIENRSLKGWLFIIGQTLLCHKRKQLAQAVKIRVKEENIHHFNIPKQPFPETVLDAFKMTQMTHIIKNFTDDYKIPYMMYLAGHNYDEIAETLNLSTATVKSRIFYAHYKLESTLKHYLF